MYKERKEICEVHVRRHCSSYGFATNLEYSVPHWLLGERSTSGKKQTPGSIRLLSPTYFCKIHMFF
jgi:hypothetical protein